MSIESNYTRFKWFLKSYIHRDGVDKLIEFLDSSDAATAPASTRYHLCVEGGYIQHSLNVFNRLITLLKHEYGDNIPFSKESIAIVALLHDISKVNYYKKSLRNVKDENGKWKSVEQFIVREDDERLVYGTHEENTIEILSEFLQLTREEKIALLYHMGNTTDSTDQYHAARMMTAYKQFPLAVFLHTADLLATCIDEVEVKEEKPKEEKKAETPESNGQDTSTAVKHTEEQVPF